MASNAPSSEPPPNRRSIWESRVLRAGGLAGALAAIGGLGASVLGLFDGSDRPAGAQPTAAIKDVEVGGLAGISSAFRRTPTARTCKRLPKGALRVSGPSRSPLPGPARLAAAQTILAQVETVPDAGESEEQAESEESTGGEGGGDGASESDSGASDGGNSGDTTKPGTVTEDQLNPPGIPHEVTLPNGTEVLGAVSPPAGAPSAAEALQVAPAAFSSDRAQEALTEVALMTGPGGSAQPLGRLVDLALRLTGLEDECVQLAWTLYDAGAGDVVPERWLQFRTGLRFVPGNADTSASEQFWVPLPRRGGRFFVRVGLFREDGTRLTVGRSEPFNQPKSDPSGFVRRAEHPAALGAAVPSRGRL
jgi:hypothetical protein